MDLFEHSVLIKVQLSALSKPKFHPNANTYTNM